MDTDAHSNSRSPIKRNVLYNTKYTQKAEARFSRLLQHQAWKRRGPILVSALHKFTSLLTWTLTVTHLLAAPDPHRASDITLLREAVCCSLYVRLQHSIPIDHHGMQTIIKLWSLLTVL